MEAPLDLTTENANTKVAKRALRFSDQFPPTLASAATMVLIDAGNGQVHRILG
jgi:hypothetical protein